MDSDHAILRTRRGLETPCNNKGKTNIVDVFSSSRLLKMSAAHPRSSVLVICVFFATASSASVATTTPMLETAGYECEWKTDGIRNKNNQSCYLFISEPKSFYQANKSCIEEGAHLVSIGNKDENALVKNLTKVTDVWIGLHRPTNESCAGSSCTTWMWLDGKSREYDAWKDSIGGTTLQCVFMNPTGTWEHSLLCSANVSFVCEKSIPSPTTPEPTTMPVTSETDTSVFNSATHGVPDKENTIDMTADEMPIIIGCVVGGIALVAIVTVVAVILLKRHRTSRPIDQPVEVKDEETPKVDKQVRYNPAYEDVETNVAFKPSPGNTDTGAPGNTDTGAHGVGDNPHNIYSEAIKKRDRPGSEGILVKENTLYGYGK